ncbi:MAG: crossover junction endodeoxyribonuclease RuvC [Patescibacteria group bacterium]
MKSKASLPTQNSVLAIDPGFDRAGIAVLIKENSKEKVLYSDCIVTNRKHTQEIRLLQIGEEVAKAIKAYKPSHLALEKLFFSQNVTTGIRVAEARGVILYEAGRAGLSVFEYTPQEIKAAVTGYGKASKGDMERMVGKLVTLDHTPQHDDEIDAIAVGITHLATHKGI